jgi:hypothetical protein
MCPARPRTDRSFVAQKRCRDLPSTSTGDPADYCNPSMLIAVRGSELAIETRGERYVASVMGGEASEGRGKRSRCEVTGSLR